MWASRGPLGLDNLMVDTKTIPEGGVQVNLEVEMVGSIIGRAALRRDQPT